MSPDQSKWAQISQNGLKWGWTNSKDPKYSPNDPKWAENVPKWAQMSKPINELKRA